jgi:DNA-directed RNA polymerase subunit K/omega
VLADGRIDPEEENSLRKLVGLALKEARAEVAQLELLQQKLG